VVAESSGLRLGDREAVAHRGGRVVVIGGRQAGDRRPREEMPGKSQAVVRRRLRRRRRWMIFRRS